jgi:hypothetical protein
LTRRANHWHYCIIAPFAGLPLALADKGAVRRDCRQNLLRQLKLHGSLAADDRLRVAEPRTSGARDRGDIDVKTAPDAEDRIPLGGR